MRWKEFSAFIPEKNCCPDSATKGSMQKLLNQKAVIKTVSNDLNPWYPIGVKHNDFYLGHRYVDMNNSYFGKDPVLLSEATCCIIVVIQDAYTDYCFAAHISAGSDNRPMLWTAMQQDLRNFFRQICFDIYRPIMFLFSNQLHKANHGSFEQKNLMKLLSIIVNDEQLQALAANTFLIEGEGGQAWNQYCSVRASPGQAAGQLAIAFADS